MIDANLFREGFIYYYENKTHGKKDYDKPSINQDFLSSRPVYVLKQRENPFDTFTINVLSITSSRHRAGIPINIDGMTYGKILPYAIYSVHTKYLTKFMGIVSEEIMREVSNAVQYYLFSSDKKPEYLIDYENNLEYVNKMTLKEKSVHDFIENRLIFKANYYAVFDELLHCYQQFSKDMDAYTRPNDFSRILTQQLQAYGKIEVRTENQIKKFFGVGLNGNTHTIIHEEIRQQIIHDAKKEIITDALPASNEELRPMLSESAEVIYDKLDLLQKIAFYQKPPSALSDVNLHGEDTFIVKRMIENDVDRKKTAVLKRLSEDQTLSHLNSIEMYVVYVCEDHEINKCISKKILDKGGAKAVRKEIRRHIAHWLR